jgi:hypothetical protein
MCKVLILIPIGTFVLLRHAIRTSSKICMHLLSTCRCAWHVLCSIGESAVAVLHGTRMKGAWAKTVQNKMHPVGFEPTSTNTFELESNPLDRSGKNAHPTSANKPLSNNITNSILQHTILYVFKGPTEIQITGIRTRCDNHLHYRTFVYLRVALIKNAIKHAR